jgi:hypothetical protein
LTAATRWRRRQTESCTHVAGTIPGSSPRTAMTAVGRLGRRHDSPHGVRRITPAFAAGSPAARRLANALVVRPRATAGFVAGKAAKSGNAYCPRNSPIMAHRCRSGRRPPHHRNSVTPCAMNMKRALVLLGAA